MSKRIETYLRKRSIHGQYPLDGELDSPPIDRVIVIPALAERDTLPRTLESLESCNPALLETTLILIVVNNRSAEHVSPEAIAENRETLEWLSSSPHPVLRLTWIDASSPGNELSRKDGVGVARKIGMDRATAILHEQKTQHPLIVCLDADTLVESNYLDALDAYAKRDDAWAGVIRYAHRVEGASDEQSAIISYELFLRYMEIGLRFARSPYAFHTIGSTIVCTPEAYAAVSGMNRKMAGEDFYFLQQLAKTGAVHRIDTTTVHPSARESWRVPFGTGKRVGRYLEGKDEEWRVYHPESYRILRDWLTCVEGNLEATGEELIAMAGDIDAQLAVFLGQLEFSSNWEKLRSQSSRKDQLLIQTHSFFDGFQTLKLIHHLRDHGYPEVGTFVGYEEMGFDMPDGVESDLSTQIFFLEKLRGS